MPKSFRVHLHENCAVELASESRKYGVDVTTTYETGLVAASDRDQLRFAESEWRVIISHDADMMRHHKAGIPHHGIIFIKMNRWSIGEIADGIVRIRERFDRQEMIGRVVKFADHPRACYEL